MTRDSDKMKIRRANGSYHWGTVDEAGELIESLDRDNERLRGLLREALDAQTGSKEIPVGFQWSRPQGDTGSGFISACGCSGFSDLATGEDRKTYCDSHRPTVTVTGATND